jgi:ComF family protein
MSTLRQGIPVLSLLDRFLALFYPDICQICRQEKATSAESYICQRCRSAKTGVRYIEPPFCDCCGLPFEGDISVTFECANCKDQQLHFRSARAAVELTGLVQDVIHKYKYNHATWFEPFLSELLVSRAAPILAASKWDFIVPIPLHWLKLRERSFNQSVRLAHHLSRATGIPLHIGLLKRIQRTHTQTRLSRAERTENVKRAFACRVRISLKGARIVLIDDVLTTGATASACAKLLLRNGAAVVDVWTVARGILK